MKITIPSPLFSYTGHERYVEATGDTLRAVLADLDQRYPGIRFRMIDEQDQMREHIRIFVNGERVLDLDAPLRPSDAVQIITSISGGAGA